MLFACCWNKDIANWKSIIDDWETCGGWETPIVGFPNNPKFVGLLSENLNKSTKEFCFKIVLISEFSLCSSKLLLLLLLFNFCSSLSVEDSRLEFFPKLLLFSTDSSNGLEDETELWKSVSWISLLCVGLIRVLWFKSNNDCCTTT